MKKMLCLAVGVVTLNFMPVLGQSQNVLDFVPENPPALEATNLTKFNLDFPGGTPAELVKAIEKATGKPLNVIIPAAGTDIQLPPLKMNDVDVTQLFRALEVASGTITTYNGPLRHTEGKYGFETGGPSRNSIWNFYVNSDLPSKSCRLYSLAPYLDHGFTVDDITTAIQTGWKMASVNPTPELDYHKETKLLIAYGEPDDLSIIRSVLDSMPQTSTTRNEINSMKSQIKDLQDQVGLLKKGVIEGRRPPPTEEKSGK